MKRLSPSGSIAIDPQLAIVELLAFAVVAASRSVIAAHPDLDLAGTLHSDPEIEAALALVEECAILRRCLDDYILRILDRHLRLRPDRDDLPF